MRPLILLSAAIILAVLALTACNSNEQTRAANTNTTRIPAADATSPSPVAQTAQSDGVRRITPAELHDALDKGGAVVIDVRNEDSYKAGHIRGARSIPVNDFLSHVDELPRDKMIVTYCS